MRQRQMTTDPATIEEPLHRPVAEQITTEDPLRMACALYRRSKPGTEFVYWLELFEWAGMIDSAPKEMLDVLAEIRERKKRKVDAPAGERAAFEAWMRDVYFNGLDDAGRFDGERNCYVDLPTHVAWLAWQAALATPAAQPSATEGAVVQPSTWKWRRLGDTEWRTDPMPAYQPGQMMGDTYEVQGAFNGGLYFPPA